MNSSGADNQTCEVFPAHSSRDFFEIGTAFVLIVGAIWTHVGPLNSAFVLGASVSVLIFAIRGRWNASQMGLTRPGADIRQILACGAVLCGIVILVGGQLRFAGPGYYVNALQSGEYIAWSIVQEFILQSVFFVRFESRLDARGAVFASAALYAIAHLPSPILTGLSFVGGIIFCELFRRSRNLYAIGLIHAALGLTIAASFPDRWMHHMRVGIGYLTLR